MRRLTLAILATGCFALLVGTMSVHAQLVGGDISFVRVRGVLTTTRSAAAARFGIATSTRGATAPAGLIAGTNRRMPHTSDRERWSDTVRRISVSQTHRKRRIAWPAKSPVLTPNSRVQRSCSPSPALAADRVEDVNGAMTVEQLRPLAMQLTR